MREYIYCPSTGTKHFSNKYYTIRIKFHEHNMAVADIESKKRGRIRFIDGWLSFDECKLESMYDYLDCLDILYMSKVARRWFAKEMKHCTSGYLRPDGYLDRDNIKAAEDLIFYKSTLEIPRLNATILKRMKPLCSDVLCANYRGRIRISCEKGAIKYEPSCLKNKAFVRKVLNRGKERLVVCPQEMLFSFIRSCFPDFYREVEQNRTMDNCSIVIEYCWWEDEFPQMRICVSDEDGQIHTIEPFIE